MKIGISSNDIVLTEENGEKKYNWGGSGWARLGQFQNRLDHPNIFGVLIHSNRYNIFGVKDFDGKEHWDCDVVVMQRAMFDDIAEKVPVAQSLGQIIVNDLDDWYWGLTPANMAWKFSHPSHNKVENINHYKRIILASDHVTCSTPWLADRVREWGQPNVTLLPNTVDVAKFTPYPHTDTAEPVVGWVGSVGHRNGDLEVLRGSITALAERGEIRLHHSGHFDGYGFFADKVGIDRRYVTVKSLAPPELYPTLLCFDVGVAPLNVIDFNRAKSAIKLLEYSAAGIPWVGTKIDAYEAFRDAIGMGRLAKNPAQWVAHVRALRDPELRAAEGAALRDAVWAFDIAQGAKALDEFFATLRR